jgi:hypothetical protein
MSPALVGMSLEKQFRTSSCLAVGPTMAELALRDIKNVVPPVDLKPLGGTFDLDWWACLPVGGCLYQCTSCGSEVGSGTA